MPLKILRDNIINVKADVIVNTANPMPTYGSGTDCAIYEAAGAKMLLAERQKIGYIAPGDIAVTPAFKLNAKYIIHAVGSTWEGGKSGEYDILKSCYRKSLKKAHDLKCKSIAFPLMASGGYGFPKADALSIAIQEIGSFLMNDNLDMLVKLVVFDETTLCLTENLFYKVESYISDNEVREAHIREYGLSNIDWARERARNRRDFYEDEGITSVLFTMEPEGEPFDEHTFDKEEFMADGKEDSAFKDHLLNLIIEKNIDNTVVYKSSNVSSKVFSKIMCGDTKRPQKKTVLGFCIGLKLNLEEAQELLASADMAFNPYDKRDKLVIQCIKNGQYNIFEVNAMLHVCGLTPLGN